MNKNSHFQKGNLSSNFRYLFQDEKIHNPGVFFFQFRLWRGFVVTDLGTEI